MINSVLVEYSVPADQSYLFHFRLRDEKPVEWIAVMKRQGGNQMYVQQQIHGMYSLKSANGASKSGANLIFPFALLNLGLRGGFIGTS